MTADRTTHVIAHVNDVKERGRIVAELDGREIAIFHHENEFYAYLNWCIHQGGPCAEGRLTGTTTASFDRETATVETRWEREGEILNCPWHGWEYDLTNGECLSRSEMVLPSYPVHIEDDHVVVSI